MNVCAAKFPLISLTKVRVWRCIPKISFLKKRENYEEGNVEDDSSGYHFDSDSSADGAGYSIM